jgi:hypothetical protein
MGIVAVLVACLIVLSLAACHSGKDALSPAENLELLDSQLPAFPVDKQTAASSSPQQFGTFTEGRSANVEETPEGLMLLSGPRSFSWGMYKLDSEGSHVDSIRFDLEIKPGNYAYIGVADYQTGKWKIYGPLSEPEVLIFLEDVHESPRTGDAHVFVGTYGGDSVLVKSCFLEFDFGDNLAPASQLTAPTSEGEAPFDIQFEVLASDADGSIAKIEWDTDGDGKLDVNTELISTKRITFSEPGIYRVLARVTDDKDGFSWSEWVVTAHGWKINTVRHGNPDGYIAGTSSCIAEIWGHPAICYSWDDNTGEAGSISYSRSKTATGENSGDWPPNIVVEADENGKFSDYSLAVIDGKPAVTYYVGEGGALHYARSISASGGTNADWDLPIVTIDSDGATGRYSSLRMIEGKPAVSYQGHDADLYYARSSTSSGADAADWQIINLLSGGNVGYDTSLAIVDGRPAIGFLGNGLCYAISSTTTGDDVADWAITTIDDLGIVSYDVSLMTVAGNPAMCYYRLGTEEIKYIRSLTADGSERDDWVQKAVIDLAPPEFRPMICSLAVIQGGPSVSYIDGPELRYAHSTVSTGEDEHSWSDVMVDDNFVDGGNTSMANIGGRAAISYCYRNEDLRYAILF